MPHSLDFTLLKKLPLVVIILMCILDMEMSKVDRPLNEPLSFWKKCVHFLVTFNERGSKGLGNLSLGAPIAIYISLFGFGTSKIQSLKVQRSKK
jgi:hypothetical protein